jgi:esterase/lipase superfamily enzyme
MTEKKEHIDVSFVTLRNQTGNQDPAKFFGGSRGEMQAGVCSVSFSPVWGLEDLANSVPFYIPDEKIELTAIRKVPRKNLYREVENFSRDNSGNLVLYFHGYNIDFEKSCRRSALFQRALGLDERLLLFSWPADGNMLKYTWDEADLVWSVPYMARFLDDLSARIGNGRLDLVAHSLGARGAVQALVRMAYREQKEPILNELVLIAPDIDADIFQTELPQLSTMARRITVYVSDNDRALRLSQEVHGYRRLGQAGEQLRILDGVEMVDISALNSTRISGHLYHLFNPEVIEDLIELLNQGKPADQRTSLVRSSRNGLPYWLLVPDS